MSYNMKSAKRYNASDAIRKALPTDFDLITGDTDEHTGNWAAILALDYDVLLETLDVKGEEKYNNATTSLTIPQGTVLVGNITAFTLGSANTGTAILYKD